MLSESGIVYKYFDLIDGFIRVRILSGEECLRMPEDRGCRPPDRREYRRMVVETCVIGLDEAVLPRVQQIYPEDGAAAEDLLYQICVDVNPKLEIHTVALPADGDSDPLGDEGAEAELRRRAGDLEKQILSRIVGQDHNVQRICRAVRKAACGLNNPERPIGTFLLVGRTGTGKTELAKELARNLYGASRLVRIDCSEYAMAHETAKLIGAPPGYVGHNDGGALTEAMLREPRAVVLFDEVEKGHEKLHNMLLQILDEGRLTDSKGRTVFFHKSLVLLTSNLGTADYAAAANQVGFGREGQLALQDFEGLTRQALRRFFKPELLNRLDDTLMFAALDRDSCRRIAAMKLESTAERLAKSAVELSWTPRLVTELATLGYDEEYGAREVRRTVDRLVEEPISNLILEGEFEAGDRIRARWRNGEVAFDKRSAARSGRRAC